MLCVFHVVTVKEQLGPELSKGLTGLTIQEATTQGGRWCDLSLAALLGVHLGLMAKVPPCGLSLWFGLSQPGGLLQSTSIVRDRMRNVQS